MKSPPIDRDKLRTHARSLDRHALLVWVNRAIELLPSDALPELIVDYANARDLAPDAGSKRDLLHGIRQFHRESLAGRYYEDFNVNSRNCMDMSRGTENWIAEHTRLLDACLRSERSGDLQTACQGFELLFDLLRVLDRGGDEIVFFADEGGSWQVGVNYGEVLPAWFRSLAPTAEPYDFAETVVDALNAFAGHETGAILAAARELATPDQKAALAEYEGNLHRQR